MGWAFRPRNFILDWWGAGIWTITRTFTGDDPGHAKCARVTANFFDVLGVHVDRGRAVTANPADMIRQE